MSNKHIFNKNNNLFNKKSQLAIFVIIGLVIIIIAGLFYYAFSTRKVSVVVIPQLSNDLKPVQQYVEGCIASVGREGVVALGQHGGYIDPLNVSYTKTNFQYNQVEQTESDMVFIDESDLNTAIPYWQYAKSTQGCWHCNLGSVAPNIANMESQLNTYMNANLPACINNFNMFKNQGFNIQINSEIKTKTTIAESNVQFLINYSLQVSKAQSSAYIDLFASNVEIPLRKYYQLSINMTQSQIVNEYLDSFAFYLVTQYSGMSSNKFPPIGQFIQSNYPIYWSKTALKNNYEDLLLSYVPFFMVKDSRNYKIINIKDVNINKSIEKTFYDAMTLDMFSSSEKDVLNLKDMEINFVYLGQPIYFNVRPSNGDLVSPQASAPQGGLLSEIPPDTTYKFFYDISYPVIVEIRDRSGKEDFTFTFALQGNIKENKLLSQWMQGEGTIPWSSDFLNYAINDPTIGIKMFDPITKRNYTNTQKKITKILFCDESQKLSGEIKLKTYDGNNLKPLENVQVSYVCGTYASCFIGTTKYNKTFNISEIRDKLPLCMNGYINLDKTGYLTKKIALTTTKGLTKNLGSIYLDPVSIKNVTVEKYVMQRSYKTFGPVTAFVGNVLPNLSNKLSNKDTVIISFTKITSGVLDEPFTQTVILGNDSIPGTNQIKLVPGRYEVKAQLLDYNGVVVPKECDEVCTKYFLGICTKHKKIPENAIPINPAMWGGIEYTNKTPFIISRTDLNTNNILDVSVIRIPDPRCLNDMQEPTQIVGISQFYRSRLAPKFI